MIPKYIKREHIIKAIEEVKRFGIPKRRSSKKFLLEYNGKHYPPKYIISLAKKYANGKELDSSQFGGGKETNNFLRIWGFKIVDVSFSKKTLISFKDLQRCKKMIIYVGDSRDVIRRIRTNHCRGNIEASALRRHVAEAKGYRIKSAKRTSGSTRVRIDLPDPHTGEMDVKDYIRSGEWKYIICDSEYEAKNFQWYVIDQLKPLLNKNCNPWNIGNLKRYQDLLSQLTNSPALNYDELKGMQSGPGVYVLYHHKRP